LFNIRHVFLLDRARDFEPDRMLEQRFHWRRVTLGGPELELRIAGRAQSNQIVVAARKDVDAAERL
jgi:hypothetical protein